MARKSSTSPLSAAEARGRLKDAQAYLELAELGAASTSPAERRVSGSNAILAGIAAADAICGLSLGERSSGDDHIQAAALLERAVRPRTKTVTNFRRLVTDKTPIQYGVQPVSVADAAALLKWAKEIVADAVQRAR